MLALLIAAAGADRPSAGDVLVSAAAVRALSAEEAAAAHPVRLRGVVTFASGPMYSWFLQDDTAGIYLNHATNQPRIAAGQVIEVEGVTGPGEFAPVVQPTRVRIVGEAPLPVARLVEFEQLASGREDSQFVETAGIVRSVRFDEPTGHYAVVIATGGGRLTAHVPRLRAVAFDRLVDARVRVRGVASTQFNRQRQLFAIRIMVPRPGDLVVEAASAADPFDVPTQRIGSLLQFAPQGTYARRVKVAGTVVHARPGATVFIEDGDFGLQVLTRDTLALVPGDRVEVLGFTAQGNYTPLLEDAVVRKVGAGTPPPPTRVNVDGALAGTHDSRLVSIDATLLDRTTQGVEQFLVLEADKYIFHAHLVPGDGGDAFAGLQNGSQVTVTGLLQVDPGEEWRAGDEWRARSFQLLLRSREDVRVRVAPPWWTLEKLLWIAGLLGVAAAAAFTWAGVLRRRVQAQTQIIRDQLRAEATLKERYVDLFENAGDMVFTHDLTGRLTSMNRTGERLLQRDRTQLLGCELVDLVAEDQRAAAREWVDLVVRGLDPPAAEWDFVNAAGQRVELEISSRLIEQGGAPSEVEGMARDVTERRRLERELLEISSREQRRIGHDLHDGVCQQLAAIGYRVDVLGDRLQQKGAVEAAEAEHIAVLINEATAHARSVARGLFPVRLEENGLVSALEELASGASQRFSTTCVYHGPSSAASVDTGVAVHLHYIAQEALLNAVKHGQATRVELSLQLDGRQGRLGVLDNGTGFRPGTTRSGMGLRIMRYRAKVIGATLDIRTRPGEGTEVACLFPVSTRTMRFDTTHA